MRRLPLQLVAVLLIILCGYQTAMAHAFLDHAEPRVGSTIKKPPSRVQIWFTQAVEPAFSKIEVFDANGKAVDKKDSHVDPADHHILIVSVPELPAGTYKVTWRVVSVDTHRTEGDFKYVVKP